MRPLVAAVIVLTLIVAAAAVGMLTLGPSADTDVSASGPSAPPPRAAASGPATGAARPQSSKTLPLATAMKELELIRPTRAKNADEFAVAMPGGGKFRLSEQRGKVVMINFWATWCPPCLEEMPAMERLYRQHKDAGFTLVAVSVDADSKVVTPFLTSHKLTFPVGLDPRMELATTYGVRALPSSFIVARDGTLAALAIGPRQWDNEAAHSLVEGLARP
jgi:peroxiredoxin